MHSSVESVVIQGRQEDLEDMHWTVEALNETYPILIDIRFCGNGLFKADKQTCSSVLPVRQGDNLILIFFHPAPYNVMSGCLYKSMFCIASISFITVTHWCIQLT